MTKFERRAVASLIGGAYLIVSFLVGRAIGMKLQRWIDHAVSFD